MALSELRFTLHVTLSPEGEMHISIASSRQADQQEQYTSTARTLRAPPASCVCVCVHVCLCLHETAERRQGFVGQSKHRFILLSGGLHALTSLGGRHK